MAASFSDDPAVPGRRIWRHGRGAAALNGVVAVGALLGGICFNAISIDIFIDERSVSMLIFLQLVSLFIIFMALMMWRNGRGQNGGFIAIQDGTLTLDLPADRSLVARPPAVSVSIPFREVQAVETRLEDLRTLFMANMQRAYRVTLRTRPAIFLFEERALNTGLAGESMRAVADEIAARAGVPFNDLGMVDGRAGVLGFFASVPSWSAAPLAQQQQRSRWAATNRTAVLVAAASLIWVVVRLLLAL